MSKKDRPHKKQKTKISKPPTPPEEQSSDEKPFDSGGMPQRDLKKNLGCG